MEYIFAGIAILAIIIIIANIDIVPQANADILERLGVYKTTWQVGLHFKIPFIDKTRRISLKEHVYDYPPQPVITKDNVTMQIDTVVFFQITDPKLFAYGVVNPNAAIENLTATTLRNIIGELELDQTLTSRDIINSRMRAVLDEATDAWGIKITRVELKNIIPPQPIRDAMEKQMKAERERRESILRAEGEKTAAILVAEGEKASAILKAEGEKQSLILQAEAKKESQIREAEGLAEAIRNEYGAVADSFKMLNASAPSDKVLAVKSLETLAKVADGKATKLIIPSELQNITGILSVAKETFSADNGSDKE